MKFPSGDSLRQLRRKILPTDAELEIEHQAKLAAMRAEDDAEIEARRAAREAEANELRLGCANRLAPYMGRLFLVTNFGGAELEESADRIRDAVLTPPFDTEMPVGIGTVLSYGRSNHEQLVETAEALKDSFVRSIGERAFSVLPERESSNFWLLSLARTAEGAARGANIPPEEVGCIAVVSALNMRQQLETFRTPDPGSAFRLTHFSEGRFYWETISLPHPE